MLPFVTHMFASAIARGPKGEFASVAYDVPSRETPSELYLPAIARLVQELLHA